jgi:cyclic-di-GMP-binding protein
MTNEPQIEQLLKKLIVPTQDLAQLGFCGGSKEAQVKLWLQSLPLTQAQQVSAQLYTAVHEISRLRTSSENRLAILELLRVPVHQTLSGLALKYLNQPLILPEAALKTATIAQAIQKHFLNSYLAVVKELCVARDAKDLQEQQALSIQRALTALGLLLLRSYQLYLPVASQVWEEAHALYQLACTLGLEQLHVEDKLPHHQGLKTIHNTYLRILLLATVRPNQLRQEEIDSTYNLLELLAPIAELDTYNPAGKENLFVVLTNSNRPPFYKSHWRPASNPGVEPPLEIRTSQLVNKLQEQQKVGNEGVDASVSQRNQLNLSAALTKHLAQAWSHLALRSFERQDVSAEIEVTVGLTNIHFYLAEEQPFNLFLNQSNAVAGAPEKGAIYQKRGVQLKATDTKKADDPWGDAFDITGTPFDGRALPTFNIEKSIKSQEKVNYQGQHPIYTVPLMDRSPGGYGLEWRNEIPVQVRAGELLGLREYGRNKWSIGVVRWAHQIKGATQLGIQIIAPHAIPVGLASVHKTGGFAEYLRALQIPELRAVNQPPSLITNAISFHEHSKARLYTQSQAGVSNEGDKSIQLTQRLFATGAFSQFGFRELVTAKPEAKTSKDDFDSVWE